MIVRRGIRTSVALAALMATPLSAQQAERDVRDERQEQERIIRLAQQSPRLLINNAVIQRERQQYDPKGLPLGGFRLFPAVSARLIYDSNVFNGPSPRDDVYARIEPRVGLRSDWTRHAISLDANAAIERFARTPTENVVDREATARGTLDINQGGHVTVAARVGKLTEARGSVGDQFAGGDPVRYRVKGTSFDASQYLFGARIDVDGRVNDYRYDTIRFGGQRFSQDFRNRREWIGRVQGALQIGPQLALFVDGSGNEINYRNPPGTVDFSSRGYALLGGVAFQIMGLLSGEAGVGYLHQRYDVLPLPTVAGITYNGNLVWNFSKLMTLSLTARRSVQQTPFAGAPAVKEGSAGAVLDYELLRGVLVKLNAVYILDDYGQSRNDRRIEGGGSVRLLLSRTLSADVAIDGRSQRSRSGFTRSYKGASIRAGVTILR